MAREVTLKSGDRQLKLRVPDDATPEQIIAFAKRSGGESRVQNSLASASGIDSEAINRGIANVEPSALAGMAPTALRAVGGIGGGVASGLLGASGVGAPLAVAAGLGIPAAADLAAQGVENITGQRQGYNPLRTAVETAASQLAPFKAASGVAGLARQGLKSGLAATGIGELTGFVEGEQPSWTQRFVSFLTGATIGALGSKKINSQNLKRDAEELVRMQSADEYAKTAAPVLQGEIVEPPKALSPPELPPAEYTKHIQDDLDELNASHITGPVDNLPMVVHSSDVKNELTQSSPTPPPNVFGDRLQLEGPAKPKYREGIRRSGGLAPMHEVVSKLDEASQQGVYQDWFALRKQHQQMISYKDSILKDRRNHANGENVWGLDRIFKGSNKNKQELYQQWLETEDKLGFEQAHGFDAHDKVAVRHLRTNYNQMFEDFGLDADTFLENYAPHIRKMDDDQFSAFLQDPNIPGPIRFFAEHLRGTEGVDRFETNGLKAAAQYLNLGSFKRYMGDSWEELFSKYNKLANSDNPALAETGQEMVDMLTHYRYRTPDRFGKMINTLLNKTVNQLGGGKFKLTAADVLSTSQQLQTAALLSGRPMSAIKNLSQVMTLTGSRLGPKWLGRGIQEYLTPAGRIRALPYTGEGIRDLSELRGNLQTPAGRALTEFNRYGMKAFTSIEEWSRGIAYNGQYLKTMEAARKAGENNVSDFLSRSDIDVMPKAVRDFATSKYLAGDVKGAADVAGDYLIQSTLFDYGPLGRPPALRKELGRTVGSFGVWPSNYVDFGKNLVTQGPVVKRVRDTARFIGLSAASGAALYGTEKHLFGREDISYPGMVGEQVLAPLAYSAGPPVSAWQAAGAGVRALTSGRTLSYSTKQALKSGASAFVPGSRAVKNISDAYNDPGGFREKAGQLFEMSSDEPMTRQRRAAAAFKRGFTRFP